VCGGDFADDDDAAALNNRAVLAGFFGRSPLSVLRGDRAGRAKRGLGAAAAAEDADEDISAEVLAGLVGVVFAALFVLVLLVSCALDDVNVETVAAPRAFA